MFKCKRFVNGMINRGAEKVLNDGIERVESFVSVATNCSNW